MMDIETPYGKAFITTLGYVQLSGSIDVEPEYRGKMEHTIVLEEGLGRPIKPGYICHHIDEDRQNNKYSNLFEISREDHTRLHCLEKEHTEEHCKKISEARKGKHYPKLSEAKKGEKNFWYGKERSYHSDFMSELWEDPEYKSKQCDSRKKSWENNTERKLEASERMNKRYEDPEERKKQSERNKGEKNGNSVLTNQEVGMIRVMLRSGVKSQAQIGRLFGVSRGVINHIKQGYSWKGV
jgi:hypothetical protein